MEFLILILKKIELIDDVILKLQEAEVHHGTIIDAKSMTTALSAHWDDVPMFGLFRSAKNHEYNEDVKMMMFALKKEQVEVVKTVIEDVIGDMNQPGTAVMFTMPISFSEGIGD